MKLKKITIIFINTIISFLLIDFLVTNYLDIRNPSKFNKSEKPIGHINKPNFSGHFGGPLDNFYNKVSIDQNGLRSSLNCKDISVNTIFIGDSTTAGFEVDDNSTFVSLINKNCSKYKIHGINAGVRAHDIHHTIANYERISKLYPHKTVFYLVGLNKFNKNHFEGNTHHSNMIKKFGRAVISDDNISFIEPSKSTLEKSYLSFRVFVSDNFYFLSNLIRAKSDILRLIRKTKSINDYKKNIVIANNQNELSDFIDLIKVLNNKIKKNNAKLVIAIYPCLTDHCEEKKFYEKGVLSIVKEKNIQVVQFVKIFNEKSKMGSVKKSEMRFPKDDHLSKIGHNLISKEIINFLVK